MPQINQHGTQHHSQRSAWPVGLAVAFVLGTFLSSLTLGGQPLGGVSRVLGATVGSGTGQALPTPLIAPHTIQAHWLPSMPARSATEQQAEARALALSHQLKAPPVGPIHHLMPAEAAAQARTAGPPLPSPRSALVQAHAAPSAPQNDSDFYFFPQPITGGVCSECGLSQALSPSVANRGKYLLMTGNWFAALSANNGSTWSYLDPYTLTGASDFCCDQQMLYEPSRNRMLWELDYFAGGYGSIYNQLALYGSAGDDLSSWCGYFLSPTLFGLPVGTAMLLPKIEYSANFLYVSFDAYNASGTWVNATVARFALTPLASCQSQTAAYVSRTDTCCFALTQGATDTMYWDTNTYTSGTGTGTTVRVFWWPEGSTSYTYQDKAIDPFNYITQGTANCASQDGTVTNWCGHLGSYEGTSYRSRAGYRGFGAPLISFAWGAGPVSGLTPFPYVVRYYFLLSNMAYKGHDNVYSPNYAVAYPSLAAPTQRGYVGGVFLYGGGTGTLDYYPGNFYLIEDPDTPSQPWSIAYLGGGGNGYFPWGDYNTVRPWNPDQLHWIAGGWFGGGGAPIVPNIVIFGRLRDYNSFRTWSKV